MRFTIKVKCGSCKGEGMMDSMVYEEDIMLVIQHNTGVDGKLQKINAIKQVKSEYGLGLLAAKELVEGAAAYYNVIKKVATDISNPGDYVVNKKDGDI